MDMTQVFDDSFMNISFFLILNFESKITISGLNNFHFKEHLYYIHSTVGEGPGISPEEFLPAWSPGSAGSFSW